MIMAVVKVALAAGGISLALATGALAQADRTRANDIDAWNLTAIPEGTGIMMATASGAKSKTVKIGRKGHAALLASRSAIELPAKTMIYRKNGKVYLVTDRKMPDSTMLFDKAKGWAGD
jgi:hypothetical protein